MSEVNKQKEVWHRGPVEGVPALLQPVAHALLQAGEEVEALMKDFPDDLLWRPVAGAAPCGFHLQHIVGVIDRLFTYAKNEPLSKSQFEYLFAEGKSNDQLSTQQLVDNLISKIDWALKYLKQVDENKLTETRSVGRAGIPSTVIGLLFHTAEHTMRHVGQLLVTVKVLKENV